MRRFLVILVAVPLLLAVLVFAFGAWALGVQVKMKF